MELSKPHLISSCQNMFGSHGLPRMCKWAQGVFLTWPKPQRRAWYSVDHHAPNHTSKGSSNEVNWCRGAYFVECIDTAMMGHATENVYQTRCCIRGRLPSRQSFIYCKPMGLQRIGIIRFAVLRCATKEVEWGRGFVKSDWSRGSIFASISPLTFLYYVFLTPGIPDLSLDQFRV